MTKIGNAIKADTRSLRIAKAIAATPAALFAAFYLAILRPAEVKQARIPEQRAQLAECYETQSESAECAELKDLDLPESFEDKYDVAKNRNNLIYSAAMAGVLQFGVLVGVTFEFAGTKSDRRNNKNLERLCGDIADSLGLSREELEGYNWTSADGSPEKLSAKLEQLKALGVKGEDLPIFEAMLRLSKCSAELTNTAHEGTNHPKWHSTERAQAISNVRANLLENREVLHKVSQAVNLDRLFDVTSFEVAYAGFASACAHQIGEVDLIDLVLPTEAAETMLFNKAHAELDSLLLVKVAKGKISNPQRTVAAPVADGHLTELSRVLTAVELGAR